MRNLFAVVIAAVVSSPAFVLGYDCAIDPVAADVFEHAAFCVDFNEFFDGTHLETTNYIMQGNIVNIIPANPVYGGGALALFRVLGVTGATGASGPGDPLNFCQFRGGDGKFRPVLLIPDCG